MGQFWIVCSVADSNHEILDGLWINRLLAIRSVRWGMPRWESPAESIDIFDLCGRQQRGALRRNCLAAEYGRRVRALRTFRWMEATPDRDQRPVSILAFICK
jgi:hypothetical protein